MKGKEEGLVTRMRGLGRSWKSPPLAWVSGKMAKKEWILGKMIIGFT